MGLGVVGLQPDGLAVRGDRPRRSFPWPQGDAEVVVGLGESGFSRMASRYAAMASAPPSLGPSQGEAEVVVGLGVVGLQPDGLAERGDGLGQLPLAAQGDAEVVVGLGVVGLQPDRLAERGDGPVDVPLVRRALPRLQW